MNRHDRRKDAARQRLLAAARRTAKIIKSTGLAPTTWFWVGESGPPAFDKGRIADFVLNKRLRQQEGTCRFHVVNTTTGKELHFAATYADGELVITVCDSEETAKAVYRSLKPEDAHADGLIGPQQASSSLSRTPGPSPSPGF
jgi:hypothetical protein